MARQDQPQGDDGEKREKEPRRRERTMLVIKIALLIIHIVHSMSGNN
ncbi:hypothetical protein [Streptomyces sp. V3I7]|nr:hypothetical protein [Streptomyces sp. V3I7]